ncbi:DUF4917 family protein [Psychromonas arctica]|uniref:DUF4917 family protein n=1 Tax=Psychromonas arctica TaxID=168275 RepID=UPI000410698F|nr:DUF4917 family protein [Psychromonas arctica]
MMKVKQWEDIKEDFKGGSLIVGNGASMAVSKKFGYKSLFEEASKLGHLTNSVQKVFQSFDVDDFELVLRRLWEAKLVNKALKIESVKVEESYQKVRTALIATVRDIHVSYHDAEEHLEHIYKFMKPFNKVVSLNYDLIVYWAAMYGNHVLGRWFKDCFTPSRFSGDDWKGYSEPYGADGATLFFYPHGNLVLHHYEFSSVKKITTRGMDNLLDSILEKWEKKDLAPAFVCEGIQESKQQSISSCDYLEKIFYEVLPNLEQNLVIYGWAMAEQDGHLLEQISKSKPQKVAVSVYQNDQVFMGKIKKQLKDIGVEKVLFFDSQSAGAWNQPSTKYIEAQAKEDAEHQEGMINFAPLLNK